MRAIVLACLVLAACTAENPAFDPLAYVACIERGQCSTPVRDFAGAGDMVVPRDLAEPVDMAPVPDLARCIPRTDDRDGGCGCEGLRCCQDTGCSPPHRCVGEAKASLCQSRCGGPEQPCCQDSNGWHCGKDMRCDRDLVCRTCGPGGRWECCDDSQCPAGSHCMQSTCR